MWAFLTALVAVIGISYGAAIALSSYQKTADTAYTTVGARPDPEVQLKSGQLHATEEHKS